MTLQMFTAMPGREKWVLIKSRVHVCHPIWLLQLSRPLKENSGQGHKGGKVLEDEASSLPECLSGLLSRERIPAPLYRKKAAAQMLIPHPPPPFPAPLTSWGRAGEGNKPSGEAAT